MNSLFERSDIQQSELKASSGGQSSYEPPSLTLLGNAHDLLAMAKTLACDAGPTSPGEVLQGDPSCDIGDPG